MAGTIFPVLATCPLTGVPLFELTQSKECESTETVFGMKTYDGKKVFNLLTRKYGWKPIARNENNKELVCIDHSIHQSGKSELYKVTLPDGQEGFIYDWYWSNGTGKDESEFLLVDASDAPFRMMGFTTDGNKTEIHYASTDDLGLIYWNEDLINGTETAAVMQEKAISWKIEKLPQEERDYILNAAEECKKQELAGKRLYFIKHVPIPKEIFPQLR